jgi:hypothetical protein
VTVIEDQVTFGTSDITNFTNFFALMDGREMVIITITKWGWTGVGSTGDTVTI